MRHLCHALSDSYALGAQQGGHDVKIIDLAKLDFPLLRTQAEFKDVQPPPAISDAQETIRWADHLVMVFPLWLGTMPAVVKGFLEQTMRPGFAFQYGDHGFTKKLLSGRSARLVVTMGMPTWIYRWFFLAHGLRGLERNILEFVGIGPVRESYFGMVENVSEDTRKKWLDAMHKLGKLGR